MKKIIFVIVREDNRELNDSEDKFVCLMAFDSMNAAQDKIEELVNAKGYDKKIDYYIDEVELIETTN